MRGSLALIFSGLVFLAAAGARAESAQSPCSRIAEVYPGSGGNIPGNGVVVFRPAEGWGGNRYGYPADASASPDAAVRNDFLLALFDPDGFTVPFDILPDGEYLIVRPRAALRQGRHLFRYPDHCQGQFSTTQKEVSFSVYPASPLPTQPGTLVVSQPLKPWFSCLPTAGGIWLTLDSSEALWAFRENVILAVTWAGKTVEIPPWPVRMQEGRLFTFVIDSTPAECSTSQSLIAGTVSVRPRLLGSGIELPVLNVDVALRCPYLPSACPVAPAPADAQSTDAGAVSSPADGGNPVPTRGGENHTGCQFSAHSQPTSALAVLLMITVAGLLGRRRLVAPGLPVKIPERRRARAIGVSWIYAVWFLVGGCLRGDGRGGGV